MPNEVHKRIFVLRIDAILFENIRNTFANKLNLRLRVKYNRKHTRKNGMPSSHQYLMPRGLFASIFFY